LKLRKARAKKPGPTKKKKALLVGLGLDSKDGHIRVTKGENYRSIGGSEQTHEVMQEKATKFNEELAKTGKRIEDCSGNELRDIAEKVKLNER
jgi:hypothetical protein